MSLAETIRNHVREHRSGMLTDLLFALVWVTGVSVLFDVLNGPQWAYYLCLGAGVVAYYGFFASLEAARERE
ncbi:hypothetical protein C499_00035 [Halogeometricum borinquense DSM 11551]|uniref:DUF8119 domain-containing protein n=2 Tax=Halogeometricum borinquense TaxID=60847 RepID=E4NW55_HALBP|nr:hypothetical protein [Halogeometricum borinquense]ADQ69275.1 hypothetical protein Hbor_39610 [Halogeometricum borinquense DSM 11551]ELY31760.1 hypothetical protein C499_00035 [Halogeometricum borinquense DSM 11551]RYJ08366.1 hypothetical protein ELS19_17600 [Halogeometricum borinquense]